MQNERLFSVRKHTGPVNVDEWLRNKAIESLMEAELTDESPAQAWVIAYRRAWNDAIEFCIKAEEGLSGN